MKTFLNGEKDKKNDEVKNSLVLDSCEMIKAMRRLNIVEIENSFLNFFTPAVIIAASQFLYNILAWTLVLISSDLFVDDFTIVIFGSIALILSIICIVLIVWFVFLPRLRIQDVRSQNYQLKSLMVVFVAFCLSILVFSTLTILYDTFDLTWSLEYPWPFLFIQFLTTEPVVLIFFVILILLINPLFDEVLYRRTIIPLLEDRGCPPILAVILASIGHGMTFLPSFVLSSLFTNNMFDIINFTIYSFFSGLIYIFTRRILYSYIFAVSYSSYQAVIALNFHFLDINLEFIFNLGQIVFIILSIGITLVLVVDLINKKSAKRWIRIIKEPSESNLKKGIVGFFGIIFVLIASQALFVKIGRILTNNNPEVTNIYSYYPFIIWFYLIAFTIPFFLTITTEYAKS